MEAAIDKDTKLVYVCNPNNPTGAITKGQDLLDFCSRVSEKVPVFVDEAYIELAVGADTQSMVSLLTQKKNVIVARTFSKIMGMAGIAWVTSLLSLNSWKASTKSPAVEWGSPTRQSSRHLPALTTRISRATPVN
jgi:bifunctional pyridoxal-dependent enzyme with beta-cystathionase and maltose regulon repressor activities